MNQPIHIGIILGSTREGRLSERIAAWVASELDKRGDLSFSIIDPLTLELPSRQGLPENAGTRELKGQLAAADAFIVVTPEYNHSFPAPLKFLIDSAYNEWQAKPVGFVAYGGMSGGIRAVEQLRQVFAELHAITVRDQLSFINVWEQWQASGPADAERAQPALQRVCEQVLWWARASKQARSETPYPQRA